jgi:glycosyltransferase involved in cell wall biosynthesis
MKISIITVVYNNCETLEDTILSVKSQQIENLEYVIIDGGSTDGTLEIIQKYQKDINIFLTEKDKGIYDAMNKGISLATGDIIGILNSDDIYFDSKTLSKVLEMYTLDPNLDILYGDLVYVKQKNTNTIVRKWKSLPYYNHFFDNGNVPPHPSLFVKKHVYNNFGLFNIKFKLAADYEFMLRIFKSNHYLSKYIPLKIVKMRLGGATNKNIANIIKGNKEILNAWKINNLKPPFTLMILRFFKRIFQFI